MSSIPVYLRVILIRHGQSENNRLMDDSFLSYWTSRRADAGLTTIGQLQAERAGAYLYALSKQMPIRLSHIYTSAMSRALQTTSILYSTMETISSAELSPPQLSFSSSSQPDQEKVTVPKIILPFTKPEVWVDVCETGGLFEATPPSSTSSVTLLPPPIIETNSSSSSVTQSSTNTTLLSSGSSTAALLAAAPTTASGNGWRGVKGLSRSQIHELYPSIQVGTMYPVPPSPADQQQHESYSPTLSVSSLQNSSDTHTYSSSVFSPTGTAGYVTEDGWWLNSAKETEAEGILRARRVANALHNWAYQLGEEQLRTEETEATKQCPGNDNVILPISGGFENITNPTETSISLPADMNLKELNRRYGGGGSGITKHDGPASSSSSATTNNKRIGRPQGAGVTPANDNVIHQGKAIAIICHGDFIDNLLREIMHPSLQQKSTAGSSSTTSSASESHTAPPLQVCSSNGSFSIFDIFPDGGARIVRLNDCRHLVPLQPLTSNTANFDEQTDTNEGNSTVFTQYPGLAYAATSIGSLLTGSPL